MSRARGGRALGLGFAALFATLFTSSAAQAGPRCGAPPADGSWFYLGEPGDAPEAATARTALRALRERLGTLPRDPTCLRVVVTAVDELHQRSRQLSRRGGVPGNTVGFHNRGLGADSTVFVSPNPHIPLVEVMIHELLHALSHRYTAEAQRRRLTCMIEGATQYLTREIAVGALGRERKEVRSGYDSWVGFFDALVGRLGDDGPALLAQAYLEDGYESFERNVDQRLGLSLRSAAKALSEGDLANALEGIGARRRR